MRKNAKSTVSQLQTVAYTHHTTKSDSNQQDLKSQLNKNINQLSLSSQESEDKKELNAREYTDIQKVRWFLIYLSTGFALLDILVFLLTGDVRLLLSSPLLVYPFITIIKFYFSNPRNK